MFCLSRSLSEHFFFISNMQVPISPSSLTRSYHPTPTYYPTNHPIPNTPPTAQPPPTTPPHSIPTYHPIPTPTDPSSIYRSTTHLPSHPLHTLQNHQPQADVYRAWWVQEVKAYLGVCSVSFPVRILVGRNGCILIPTRHRGWLPNSNTQSFSYIH